MQSHDIAPNDYIALAPRDDFDAAYERTREMQVLLLAFFEGSPALRQRLGREPTKQEVLRYVTEAVLAKSPRAQQTSTSEGTHDGRPQG
jgi:hypothetical protein